MIKLFKIKALKYNNLEINYSRALKIILMLSSTPSFHLKNFFQGKLLVSGKKSYQLLKKIIMRPLLLQEKKDFKI